MGYVLCYTKVPEVIISKREEKSVFATTKRPGFGYPSTPVLVLFCTHMSQPIIKSSVPEGRLFSQEGAQTIGELV